jgi:hypothetical protein
MTMALHTFIASQLISFLGIGDTGDAQLAILVSQSAQQLAELNRLLSVANQSSETLNRALEMTEKVQAGIDRSLKSYRTAKEFQDAIVRLGKNRSLKGFRENAEEVRDYMETYKDLFPERAKIDDERRKDFDSFQNEVQKTSEADLREIEALDRELLSASPARSQQISAQIQLKQLEGQIVSRQQIARLIEENNQLREEAARERRRRAMEDVAARKLVEDRWKSSWEPKR